MPALGGNLRPSQEYRIELIRMSSAISLAHPPPGWIPTKVDLHVHGITWHPEKEPCRLRNSAGFLQYRGKLQNASLALLHRALIFHSIETCCPDLRVSLELSSMFP
jgi:hypothetical protein